MSKVAMAARILLGLGFIVFGANAFLQFLPPPPMEGDGAQFLGLLMSSGYFKAIAIVKIAAGIMLVAGRFVPLGLTLLGPVLVNILLYHLVFDPAGIGMGLVFTALWFVAFAHHRQAFAPLLRSSS